MKRSNFLASLAALAVAPFVKTDVQAKTVPPSMPKFNRVAYDLRAIPNGLTAKQVFELYRETGVLLYQSRPDWPLGYHGVQVIEGDIQVKEHGKV